MAASEGPQSAAQPCTPGALAWETIVALADHKRGYRAATSMKPEFKTELWMLFPTSGIVRTLALEADKLSQRDQERATRLFGTERWRTIYELRVQGRLHSGLEWPV
jgi:hypothetical protein